MVESARLAEGQPLLIERIAVLCDIWIGERPKEQERRLVLKVVDVFTVSLNAISRRKL
jgi:hypothetical protein